MKWNNLAAYSFGHVLYPVFMYHCGVDYAPRLGVMRQPVLVPANVVIVAHGEEYAFQTDFCHDDQLTIHIHFGQYGGYESGRGMYDVWSVA